MTARLTLTRALASSWRGALGAIVLCVSGLTAGCSASTDDSAPAGTGATPGSGGAGAGSSNGSSPSGSTTTPSTTPAAQEERYAAIWEKTTASAFQARHRLTSSEYQTEFDKWTGDGYCLTDVSGYDVAGEARFAAIWEQGDCPTFVARHGLTSAQYQQEFDKWTGQGYRPTFVNGYAVGGEARFAARWDMVAGGAFVARHDLTSSQYQTAFDDYLAQGYCLTHVSGYASGGVARFAAIWEKASCPSFMARHDLTPAAYQDEFDQWTGQGYRLSVVSGYRVAGKELYAALWTKDGGPAFVAHHAMTSADYQKKFDDLLQEGYRLKLVRGY